MFNSTPLVSIIVPSFQQGPFIETTIKSILSQSYHNLEIIIVDACSTDNTNSVLCKYSSSIHKIIQEPDNGQADAINKGLLCSSGDIVGWLNSDDLLYPDSLKLLVSLFSTYSDVDFIYGNVDYGIDENHISHTIKGQAFRFIDSFRSLTVPIPQQGCFWRRSVIDSLGLLDIRWHYVLDRDYFIRMSDKFKSLYIDSSLGLFRCQPASKSLGFTSSWIKEMFSLYAYYYEHNILSHPIDPYKCEVLSACSLSCSLLAFRSNQILSAIRYVFLAFKYDIFILFKPYSITKLNILINRFFSK